MTINDTWGYKSFDTNFKSTSTLLRNLIDIASKGGNYLLNVGPEPTGLIPGPEVDRLKEVGEWLKSNGSSIYATSSSPYQHLPFDGRATVKGNSLYLNVFSWPQDGLKLKGLQTAVQSARAVNGGQKLKVEKADDGTLTIEKPSKIDPISTTIELKLAARPVVVEPEYLLTPSSDGRFRLNAADATLEGSTIQIEGQNVGYWMNAKDAVDWKITVPSPAAGEYKVRLRFSCEPGNEGSTYVIDIDGQASSVTGKVEKTASWSRYTDVDLSGTVSMTSGTHTIRIRVLSKPGNAVMNVRSLTLSPKAE